MKIKICGIKTIDEAKIMNEEKPDFIGFVFAQSKRQISFDEALKIKKILNPDIKTVGVFVDTPVFEIIKLKNIIDIVQFHGEYFEEDIKIAKNEGFETIKVIRVKEKEYDIKTDSDYLLFDTYSKTQAGGLNKTFDWDIKIKTKTPYFIAGGINADNISEMERIFHPFGADISSGVEVNGFKTKEKVADIMRLVRA